MYFFATGKLTHPDQIGPYLEAEKRVLAELRDEGVVREAFTPTGGHGVIAIFEGPGLDEVQADPGQLGAGPPLSQGSTWLSRTSSP
jgi:hypothetical protein